MSQQNTPQFWSGFCPECALTGKSVRMRLNDSDFFESEETCLQICVIPGLLATILNFRGEGKFRSTPSFADESPRDEILCPQITDFPPFGDPTRGFQSREELETYIGTTKMMNDSLIESAIISFLDKITVNAPTVNQIEVYNEFSLQHELGIHLRTRFPNYLTQFERNISYFASMKSSKANKKCFAKKEIDISVFDRSFDKESFALELKFPRNNQVPEQMFSFCKDIQFAEQLRSLGFEYAYVLTLVDDPKFMQGANQSIYQYFRGHNPTPINGIIAKPTGVKNGHIVPTVSVNGSYQVRWRQLPASGIYYYLLKIDSLATLPDGALVPAQVCQPVNTLGKCEPQQLVGNIIANFDDFQIRKLESGEIQVFENGVQIKALPALKQIANQIGNVPTVNTKGNPLNTRQLGAVVISKISQL